MKHLDTQTYTTYQDHKEGSAPATPASGYVRQYAKTDGKLYSKDDAGTETELGGGSGGSADHAYYARLAALLEPDALEYPRHGTFTYAINSTTTKYLMLAWNCYIDPNANARYDVRNPVNPLPLRNVTIKGASSASQGLFLDPALPTYADARDTYFNRLESIATLATKSVYVDGGSTNNKVILLPGPYGIIVTSVMAFDYGWVGLGNNKGDGTWPLDYENNDSTSWPIRYQHTMTLPVTKAFITGILAGYPNNGNARGTITYVILPSTWSAVTDPNTYTFRDDFMASTLDTGVWTKAESTGGNVQIDTAFQWLKVLGSGSWGPNAAYKTTGITRANGLQMVADVHDTALSACMVGWFNGTGTAQADMQHGLIFNNLSGQDVIRIIDNGTDRGTVGSGSTGDLTYRVRITLSTTGGAATYEVQGGSQYPAIGSGSWTTLTGSGTGSADNTLHPGFATHTGTAYVSDVRIY